MSADDLNTKPTIETILEKLSDFRQSFETRLDKLESDVSGLRTEMQDGFRRLDRKLELHAKNFSDLYADERELESRVSKLEDKAS